MSSICGGVSQFGGGFPLLARRMGGGRQRTARRNGYVSTIDYVSTVDYISGCAYVSMT